MLLSFLIVFCIKFGYGQDINQTNELDSLVTRDSMVQTEEKKEEPKLPNKFYKSPGKAMLFSTLLPGVGQYYTENYLKGALITTAWGTLGFLSIREHLLARDALAQNKQNSYVKHRDQRNLWLWWTAAVWVFSIADAYVSSHMYKFKEQETLSHIRQKFNLALEFKADPFPCWGIRLNRLF